jgi:hypothetical protein
MLLCYLRLVRRWKCKSDARVITIQREQYDATVHLFIGTWCNPDKITSMPLTFNLNYNASYQGRSSLFLFRPVPSFILAIISSRSSFSHSFRGENLHPKAKASCNSLCYTKHMISHVFEDLRKRKAPNRGKPNSLADRVEGFSRWLKFQWDQTNSGLFFW